MMRSRRTDVEKMRTLFSFESLLGRHMSSLEGHVDEAGGGGASASGARGEGKGRTHRSSSVFHLPQSVRSSMSISVACRSSGSTSG